MNNKNKMLVGCLALLLVLSVGYALFSDTITINGTATAKGEFDINGSCQTGFPSELASGVEYQIGLNAENGYKNDTCSFVDDVGTFNVELEYPGARRYFTVKMTNEGTIPAVLETPNTKDVDVCIDDDKSGVYDEDECFSSDNSYITPEGFGMMLLIKSVDIVGVQVGDGEITPYDKITQKLANEFLDAKGNYILKPGNSIFYIFETEINPMLTGNGILSYSTMTLEFPFTQITE